MTLIPVFNYYVPTLKDDINQNGCPYERDCFTYYYNNPEPYEFEGSYVLPFMRDKIGKAFNLSKDDTQKLNYNQFYYYADVLMAENFEGDTKREYFSPEEWYYIRLSQKVVLSKGFDTISKPLYGTRFFR